MTLGDLKICFYNEGRLFKRGTILGHVAEALQKRNIACIFGDEEVEPDLYIFEKWYYKTRYKKPVIIHAENLIGENAKKFHCYNRGDAIVFNSEWLRRLYRNTYGSELKNVWVIPPAHQMDDANPHTGIDVSCEQHIVCISKWWKRPYKRFPLIARAFDYLNRQLRYPNARLHVHGWLTDQPMPYVDTGPRLWNLPKSVRENPNIMYYQKSFHNDTYKRLLSIAHLVVHVSAVDTGPQVIVEAISQGIPVVITNNMGAAEWIRDIGPESGKVLDIDRVAKDYNDMKWLIPSEREGDSFYGNLSHLLKSIPYYSLYYRRCSDTSDYREVAYAMKEILDNYSHYRFEPPKKFTMDGIAEEWLKVVESVIG